MAGDQKITLGQMCNPDGGRGETRGLLVDCADYKCGHMVRLAPAEVNQWPEDVRLPDLEPKFNCAKCG